MKNIIMLDPRGILFNSDLATIQRHKNYIDLLNKESNIKEVYRLTILSLSKNSKIEMIVDGNLIIKSLGTPTINFIKYSYFCAQEIKQNLNKTAFIVCGDPWISFLSAYFLRIFVQNKLKIQIQIHADISSPEWTNISLKNYLKKFIHKFAVNNSDQIRVVSSHLKDWLIHEYKIESKKVIVSPVPLNLIKIKKSKSRASYVAFFGRIEADRGVFDFVKMIQIIANQEKNLKVMVIGEGELKNYLNRELKKLVPARNLIFTGHLNGTDLVTQLQKVKMLLSTAPSESYGMAVRECLVNGIPVLAITSPALMRLRDKFDGVGFELIQRNQVQNGEFMKFFLALQKCRVAPEIKKQILIENWQGARQLVLSWKNLDQLKR